LRESATTLLAIGAVLALATGFSVGTVAYLDQQGTRGIQTALSTRGSADLALRASLSLGLNPSRQDRQVRAAIADSFAPSRVDVVVTRTLSSHVTVHVLSDDPDEMDRGGSAQSIPDFGERADLVAGTAATASTDVAVQVDAAEALGLEPGTGVLIAGVPFTVSGTWRAKDVLDPRWYGDAMIASGYDDDFGPFVIDERAWGRLDVNPDATWTVVPDASQIDSTNIGSIIHAWASIRTDWRGSVDSLQTLTPQNRLVQTLTELEDRLSGLRAVEPVVFTLLTVVALVGLSELVRLLVSTRRRVTTLYWARGDSRRGIAGRFARDVGGAAAAGAVVGGAVAVGAVLAIAGVDAVLGIGWIAAIVPAAVGGAALVFAVTASRPEPVARVRPARRGGRNTRRLAVSGVVVLLTLAAVVSVWQLRLYGSPLTPTIDGTGDVDPIAVVAPALALGSAVMICVVAFPRIAALNERRVRAGRLTSQLAARGIITRSGVLLAPMVLMALAAASVTVAAAYGATWDAAFGETAALRSGADLHANARIEGITPAQQDAALNTDGVGAAAPLEIQPLTVGTESGSIVAATPAAVAALAVPVPGAFDPSSAAALIDAEVAGPVLPDDTRSVLLTVEAEGFVAPPELSLYLSDGAGFLRRFDLGAGVPVGADDDHLLTYASGVIPAPSAGAWRIAAVDMRFADQEFHTDIADLHLIGLDATTPAGAQAVSLDVFWIADSPGLQVQPPLTDGQGSGVFLFDDTPGARLTVSLTATVEDRPHPPILVSQRLADRFGITTGDALAFNVQDGVERLDCIVAGVIPAVPGAPTEAAVLIDLGVIQHFQLRTTAVPAFPRDLWIAAADPPATADAVRSALPANTRVDSARDPVGRQILGSAAIALWAAAGCITLLALAGIASSARARLRSGRNDVAVLRALGLSVRDQTRIPVGELGVVLVVGAVAGLVAGGLVAILTIPYFARAAVAFPYLSIDTRLAFDLVGWSLLTGLLCGGALLVLLVTGRAVAGVVRDAVPGEDAG
jgi:hypothetical protein